MISADQLVAKVKAYDSHAREDLIRQAYAFSMKAHENQKRISGEPYFIHPVAVAEILTTLKLDSASIVTGLLHDTVEDTLTTLDEISTFFGKDIAFLVDGVTKLSHVKILSDKAKQAEQFRKLLMAMASDIRVLLVKLADRLHNMRTLHFLPKEEKRLRIARETIDIYAPLAERIGLRSIKEELEDLAFSELNPDARLSLLSRLKFLRTQDADFLTLICAELQDLLKQKNLEALVVGREKTPYSIWRKMQRKNLSFEQLSDIMAFRISVNEIPTCYQVLGILHSHYAIVPGRFKDYISLPRNSHYQSLHTTLIGPLQRRIEVQIRTHEMDQVAELGVAAHWQYKQGFQPEKNHYSWIRELLTLLEQEENPEEFLEHTKLEMFPHQVFCFTPKGNLITLPRGASAIDFAYAVHSRIGNTCVGAKINGRLVPLRTIVENGDQVEILNSSLQTPSPSWEHCVVTVKARSSIRRFIKEKQNETFIQTGRDKIEAIFQEGGVPLKEELIFSHLKAFGCASEEEFLLRIGRGEINARNFFCQLFPEKIKHLSNLPSEEENTIPSTGKAREDNLPIQGTIPGMEILYGTCCHPLPGDAILGAITVGKGITIHTRNCNQLAQLDIPTENLLDVSWKRNQTTERYVGCLALTLVNQPGSLAALTTLIAKMGTNITVLKIRSRHSDSVDFFMDIEVKNVEQLDEIIALLRMSSWVLSAKRWGHP